MMAKEGDNPARKRTGLASAGQPRPGRVFLAAAVALVALCACASCGYSVSPSPYQLRLPEGGMSLHIPIAENRSRYGRLGPQLTRNVTELLDGTPGLRIVGPPADGTLKLSISSVVVGSGSWEILPDNETEIPESSSSRTATVTVDAVFTRPGEPGGAAVSKRRRFTSSRTYVVTSNQGQTDMQEAEALEWIMDDIGRKIAIIMFTEF
ncbi:MAG: LPS assembly lipoprotein LptE [Deltaproteobacteria bacterium]|nr:LPS assembly lipoprotein LptE [Deltaproteobacteria bacterium]